MTAPLLFPFPDHVGTDPAPGFHDLTQQGRLVPVTLRSGAPALVAHRYEDVCRVLTDPAFVRSPAARFGLTGRSTESLALNAVDPPDHTRRRRVVAPDFSHRRAGLLRPEAEALAESLLDRMLQQAAPADLLAGFVRPYTTAMSSRVLGLPEDDVTRLLPLVERMMSTTAFTGAEVESAHHAMFEEMEKLLDARPAGSGGMLGTVADALRSGEDLTPHEAVHLAYGLLIAAHETTTNQLTVCALMLLRDPELAQRLRDRPDLRPNALAEMLRIASLNATGGVPHYVRDPVTLAGVRLEPGTIVVPLADGANRDPEMFPAPDTFRLDRTGASHVSFGHGRHRCPGAHLALMELDVGMNAVLRQPRLRLAIREEELRWRTGMYVRGVRSLPVTW